MSVSLRITSDSWRAQGADAIEVWNEPNIQHEWPSGQINGASYTRLLQAAYQAIKAANPATIVISGAPAPTGFSATGCEAGGCNDNTFVAQMAQAGAANYMDCVGVHYNAGAVPPTATSGAPVGSAGHYSWYLPSMMQVYRAAFPSKPLCFTELGYVTGESLGDLPTRFAWANGNSLAEQAAWLAGAVNVARGSGYVSMIIVWNVNFTAWGADPQAGYAMLRPGGGCPACDSLGAVMRGLEQELTAIESVGATHWVARFCYVSWARAGDLVCRPYKVPGRRRAMQGSPLQDYERWLVVVSRPGSIAKDRRTCSRFPLRHSSPRQCQRHRFSACCQGCRHIAHPRNNG